MVKWSLILTLKSKLSVFVGIVYCRLDLLHPELHLLVCLSLSYTASEHIIHFVVKEFNSPFTVLVEFLAKVKLSVLSLKIEYQILAIFDKFIIKSIISL